MKVSSSSTSTAASTSSTASGTSASGTTAAYTSSTTTANATTTLLPSRWIARGTPIIVIVDRVSYGSIHHSCCCVIIENCRRRAEGDRQCWRCFGVCGRYYLWRCCMISILKDHCNTRMKIISSSSFHSLVSIRLIDLLFKFPWEKI